MIFRFWHGWTSPDNADAYEQLVDQKVVPSIIERGIPGLRHVDILRRRSQEHGDEVEFVTVMTFDDWAAVEAFAGPGGTTSFVPEAARALLSSFDADSQHYELVGSHEARAPR
ncbi:antibiotic biosynthesis monooxygenase [Actinobacteria bacterium YIM 96077]|uniref:Antibiotic biosynthesis monooxygenase n=1 Tax=Phytoactinopolyspora halophila TaxID=1981511 RepID=A0A329R189_9ACTN|nr:Dabb family protein [Phytoactinopolyspora halophila]AYY15436.1 antibiotic biosynthesis monooxygenase [Actinobacteria bacterium YIM 96077]RAW17709.1 antibiotic biosynthesis monooxygenase [Phytoactinopolyspora halophila]